MITLLEGDLTKDWLDRALSTIVVGCDIETSGLSKEYDKIATFQMYVPDSGVVMVRKLGDYPEHIIALLEARKTTKVFHHAPFDLGFLIRDYPYMVPMKIADTKVAAKILDPKRKMHIDKDTLKGSHSLKTLVEHYFGFTMDKKLAVSDWFADVLDPAQLDYAAKDVEFLPELLRRLLRQLKERGTLHLAREAFAYLPTKVILDSKIGSDVYGY